MNIVANTSRGTLSTLVPTTGPLDLGGNWQVLDPDGEPLYSGTLDQCEAFMQCAGLREHCNCELVDLTGTECIPGYGWDAF